MFNGSLGINVFDGMTLTAAGLQLTITPGSIFNATIAVAQWNGSNWAIRESFNCPAGGALFVKYYSNNGSYPEWYVYHVSGSGNPTFRVVTGGYGGPGQPIYYYTRTSSVRTGNSPARVDSAWKANRGVVILAGHGPNVCT